MKLSLALVAVVALAAPEVPVLTFGQEVRGVSAEGVQGADPAVLLVSAPKVRLEKKAILAELIVENPSEAPLTVVTHPYGGSFPYGGDHPFTLRIASANVKYAGKLYPPEPPLPMAITFPAKARVAFTTRIDLASWDWTGEPEVELAWGFYFARGKAPGGTLKLKLPKR